MVLSPFRRAFTTKATPPPTPSHKIITNTGLLLILIGGLGLAYETNQISIAKEKQLARYKLMDKIYQVKKDSPHLSPIHNNPSHLKQMTELVKPQLHKSQSSKQTHT